MDEFAKRMYEDKIKKQAERIAELTDALENSTVDLQYTLAVMSRGDPNYNMSRGDPNYNRIVATERAARAILSRKWEA